MLTKKEEKLIRKQCLYPVIGRAALLMVFVLSGVWILLVMLDDIKFDSKTSCEIGIYAYFVLIGILIVILAYCLIAMRIGIRGEQWKEIVQKAKMYQAGEDHNTQVAATEMEQKMNLNAKMVADAFHLDIPSLKKYVFLMIVLPILILVGLYIPEYRNSVSVKREELKITTDTVDKVRDALESVCISVSADDPIADYQKYGYSVIGHLNDVSSKYSYYIYVKIGNDGLIHGVTYHADVDLTKSKEENLELLLENFATLHDAYACSGVEASTPEMFEVYQPTQEFLEKFQNNSYYTEISLSEEGNGGARIYYTYATKSEEEYNEYSSSYVEVCIQE